MVKSEVFKVVDRCKKLRKQLRKNKPLLVLPDNGNNPHMNHITNKPKTGYRTVHEATVDARKLKKRFGNKYATYKCGVCRMYHLTTKF